MVNSINKYIRPIEMYIIQDFHKNSSIKSKFILCWFRLSQIIIRIKFKPLKVIMLPIVGLYRLIVDWVMGIDLPPSVNIGPGTAIFHGQGLVIGKGSHIGSNCLFRHGVTIGRKINKDGTKSSDPLIGNNVEFGANSSVIGDVIIGDNCIIGAGVVVTKSLDNGTIIVGGAPRILSGSYKADSN